MRNDVSCAVFSCVGPRVQDGHVLWEVHGRGWDMAILLLLLHYVLEALLPHFNGPKPFGL